MREARQLGHVLHLIESYDGSVPLHRQLSQYFTQHRNMGSRDRRITRSLIYPYFRLGAALPQRTIVERLAAGNFLCATPVDEVVSYLYGQAQLPVPTTEHSLEERCDLLRLTFPEFKEEDLVPFENEISPAVDRLQFRRSVIIQPYVWIRVRQKYVKDVADELMAKGLKYHVDQKRPLAWAFAPSEKLDDLEVYQKGYFEIQDISSQCIADYVELVPGETWWDTCAASGGKSLLLLEKEPTLHLTATDIRQSILVNYVNRLNRAGYDVVEVRQADLSTSPVYAEHSFDGILADVPCSGSGTWARTPEMLTSLKSDEIREHFQPLQRAILKHVTPTLKKGGRLIFATCSVFSAENEENVRFIQEEIGLEFVQSNYISGSSNRGDTLFVAVFVKT